jgi:hypothetical protein
MRVNRQSPPSPNALLSGAFPQIPIRNVNGITSPVFAALSDAFREQNIDAEQVQDEERIPNSTSAPEPSIDQLGTSPVTQQSLNNEDVRGGFSNQSPSNSPRLAYRHISRRTSSYQFDALATSPRGRPVSMPAHMYQIPSPSGLNLNQARGIPGDVIIGPSRSTSRKASKYNFCSFDSLSHSGDTILSDNTLLAASDNSLYVFKIEKEKISRIGKIDGLRGYVVSAKILPCTSRSDSTRDSRPLIVAIIHGPLLAESPTGSSHSDHQFDPSQGDKTLPKYQTTVEVYSLRERKHVATLYSSEAAELELDHVLGKKVIEPPEPIGALSIHVSGKFIVVSSGESGEIYIFDARSGRPDQPFRCIGKTWTSVPQRKSRTWSTSSAPSEAENFREKSPTRPPKQDNAVLSLNNRWLAYIPPVPSTRSTVFGKVKVPSTAKGPPGIRSHTASSQPQTTCELDTPLEESKLNKVARDVTQEFIKGARWVGDQGFQAWKSYWNKSPDAYEPVQAQNPQFPPTHALDDPNRLDKQPTVVSILDLEKLANNQDLKADIALQPIATFSLPGGCSFLSFSPNGLGLLTASSKGDVQYVWDLMQVVNPRITINPLSPRSEFTPVIRQIARFTRVTVASIVDVAWSEPRGEKLAVITDRGTVHLHDLPLTALQWPPAPRLPRSPAENKSTEIPSPSSGGWNSALNAVSGASFAAVRGNSLMNFGGFNLAQASAGAGVKGSKIMASGFSRSVEAATGTVNSLMHMGETRFHIPGASHSVSPGCARWWVGKDNNAIAVTGDGVIFIHRVLLRKDGKNNKKKHSVVGERIAEISIPNPRDKQDHELPNDGFTVDIVWPEPVQRRISTSFATNPLSYAEIDTSSPYQPFHTDRRVNLFTYIDSSYKPIGAWIFGEDIGTRLMRSGADHVDFEDFDIPLANESESIDHEEIWPPKKSKLKGKSKTKVKRSEPISTDKNGEDDLQDFMI